MTRITLLDSTAVGLACNPGGVPEFDDWFESAVLMTTVVIPAAADFEVRRELVRADGRLALGRLDRLVRRVRLEDMTAERWQLAARLWAEARNRGRPTADPRALDIDVLIAATALSLSSEGDVVIATENVRHLAQFADARSWRDIRVP